ncbi:hypothetical protein [Paraburkholderia fungorum]|uniref:hypothetical protein n=1 Tax=Paraburkholderia fungorum TaxID=134537 RepID=UPI0038BDBEB0
MVKRRQFIGGLAALGGSYLLSACGGGSEDSGSGAPGSAVSKATVRASAASASGTSMPPAASITDSTGAVWTLSGGVVYQNGAKAGNNYNVKLALWYAGSIYHENTSGQFYQWNGSTWLSCIDPRVGSVSADGTTLPSAPYIIDKSGAKWTLVNGVIYKNGAVVGTNFNVSLVVWYGGKIYHCNTAGHFYANAEVAAQWLACTDPRIAVAPAAGCFYGMNGHFDYTYSPSQLASILKGMGCTSYRVGCTSDPAQINAVAKLAQTFQSAGITLIVLINQGLYDSSGKLFSGESTAYSAGYTAGSAVARALMAYGVTIYECGNELTRDGAIILDSTNAGTKALDFNNTNWPVMRGVMRGMIDGVKSVQPSAKCGINFCVNDVGAADALWEGTQPNGSSGYPTVRWDVTTWHNYEVYGDIFNIGTDGAGPGFDLPTYCKARYGVPFIITEWNTGPEQTQAYRASYITAQLGKYYQARKTHNIQSVMYYVLDSGNNTFGIMLNGSQINPSYSAFTSFTSGNPDK